MALNDYPMYSPFKAAKYYKGFIFDNKSDHYEQITKFKGYDKIKWMPEKKAQNGTYQPVPGLVMTDGVLRIKTNSQLGIQNGDYISLEHPAFKGCQFFTVGDTPEIESDFFPKYRQKFQHIVLKPTNFKTPNS